MEYKTFIRILVKDNYPFLESFSNSKYISYIRQEVKDPNVFFYNFQDLKRRLGLTSQGFLLSIFCTTC